MKINGKPNNIGETQLVFMKINVNQYETMDIEYTSQQRSFWNDVRFVNCINNSTDIDAKPLDANERQQKYNESQHPTTETY